MIPDIYVNEVYCINCGSEDLSFEGSYPSGDKFIFKECNEDNWAVIEK